MLVSARAVAIQPPESSGGLFILWTEEASACAWMCGLWCDLLICDCCAALGIRVFFFTAAALLGICVRFWLEVDELRDMIDAALLANNPHLVLDFVCLS